MTKIACVSHVKLGPLVAQGLARVDETTTYVDHGTGQRKRYSRHLPTNDPNFSPVSRFGHDVHPRFPWTNTM